MPNTLSTPNEEFMDAPEDIVLLPANLWTRDYLIYGPGILPAATRSNPLRVAELFSSPATSATQEGQVIRDMPPPPPATVFRVTAPAITPYDGQSSTLRAFCSQLVNQIRSCEHQFPSESAKVSFAYQCLGPGALVKMRSSFRCLEDPTIPAEITTLVEFLDALKKRCQDPSLREKASLTVETLYQNNMKFHDFITVFEDNMTDSSYGHLDKENWKVMLERRLSTKLRNALVTAANVPDDYHEFVSYLREKDAAFHEINSARKLFQPQATTPKVSHFTPASFTPHSIPQFHNEPTVSQGGNAMDLDAISKERGPDGRLTPQAKNARYSLGRCVRCNLPGHKVVNCPLGNKSTTSINTIGSSNDSSEQLKE